MRHGRPEITGPAPGHVRKCISWPAYRRVCAQIYRIVRRTIVIPWSKRVREGHTRTEFKRPARYKLNGRKTEYNGRSSSGRNTISFLIHLAGAVRALVFDDPQPPTNVVRLDDRSTCRSFVRSVRGKSDVANIFAGNRNESAEFAFRSSRTVPV